MQRSKFGRILTVFLAGFTLLACGSCGEEAKTNAPEKKALTEIQWKDAFSKIEKADKLAAEITYTYNVPADDLTTAWTVKMDGNIRYQKEVQGNNAYVYEGYSVYDDATMTMVNYRLDGVDSSWTKRTNTYTENNYEDAKKKDAVLYSIGLYYYEYSLSATDTMKYTLADLFTAFTYDKESNLYRATLYMISDYDEQNNPVYTATKFTCEIENEMLVQIVNEYEFNGIKSVTTIKLTQGESFSVPQAIVDGATEVSGGKK